MMGKTVHEHSWTNPNLIVEILDAGHISSTAKQESDGLKNVAKLSPSSYEGKL